MNQDKHIPQDRSNTINIASTTITSRNHSNKPTKRRIDILKYSISSRKSISTRPESISSITKRILIANGHKHNSTPEIYYKHIITSIIFDDRKKIVSIFKNYLLWEETSEFLKRYYFSRETHSRIPKISSYYENYTLFNPVYFSLSFSVIRIMNRFIKRKKRHLEYLEDNEDKEVMVKEQLNDMHSKLIKASQIKTRMLISAIVDKGDDREDENTMTLTRLSVDNSKMSFNELINRTLSDEGIEMGLKEEDKEKDKGKSKKFILKKTITHINDHNAKANADVKDKDKDIANTKGVHIPKINLQGITKFITESNANRNNRNSKQNNEIMTYANSKTMSNNSINNQIKRHLTTTARLYSNKTKAIINKDLQSRSNKVNFNVNVNLNVNLNININSNSNTNANTAGNTIANTNTNPICNTNPNRQPTHNKLVLTTKTNNLRHKMLIAERISNNNHNDLIIPKIIQNSGATHMKTKRFLDTRQITLESVVRESSTITPRKNPERLLNCNGNNPNKGKLIAYSKIKTLNKLMEIPKIPCSNYPLTTRASENNNNNNNHHHHHKGGLAKATITKLNPNKVIRNRKGCNTIEKRKPLVKAIY